MSQHAKTVVAAVAAVLLAGVQAWQTAVDGGPFRPLDALPIAIAVAGAVLVHVIPNTGDQPVAKAVVAGVLAALNGAATILAGAPANITALNLVVAALGALVTWYVPELAPELAAAKAAADVAVKVQTGQPVGAVEITDALRALEQLDPAQAALDANASQATVELPAQPGPVPVPAPAGPLPIEAAALAAAQAAASSATAATTAAAIAAS